jgi:hypothetical protein
MRAKVAAAVIGALLAAASASALTVDELDVNFGFIYIGTADPSALGPSIVTPLYGVSLPIQLVGPFFVEPVIEFYSTYYMWTGTAVAPAAMETGNVNNAFFAIGSLISLQAGVRWPVSRVITLGGALGVDFLLRFPAEFLMADPNTTSDTSSPLAWFYQSGRFVYPEVRLFMKWQATEAVGLVVNLRAWYPLYQLWDGQPFPFPDQFMFAGGIGFAIRLGRAAPAAAAAPK